MPDLPTMEALETSTAVRRIHVDDPFGPVKLAEDLKTQLRLLDPTGTRSKVLLCIGTDRSTGDCLGPLVGSRLNQLPHPTYAVYGTLEQPVHATNLAETTAAIQEAYDKPIIIAVDACLGYLENVGSVNVGPGSIRPGAGVKKNLPEVGDLHITGVVNVGGFMEYLVLQNTRLNLVMRLAELIVKGLTRTVQDHRRPTISPAGVL